MAINFNVVRTDLSSFYFQYQNVKIFFSIHNVLFYMKSFIVKSLANHKN